MPRWSVRLSAAPRPRQRPLARVPAASRFESRQDDRFGGARSFPRVRQEQRLQIVEKAATEHRRSKVKVVAFDQPASLGGVELLRGPASAESRCARRTGRPGTPSVRRSALSMNSKPMSSRATSCFSSSGAPRSALLHVLLRLLVAHLAHDAIAERQLRMRAGADAEIVAEAPVVEIVPAFAAGFRVRRRFVMQVARASSGILDRVLDVRRRVVVGQRRRMAVKQRVRLDRQVIERQMRRRERQAPRRRRRARRPASVPAARTSGRN